MGSLEMRLIRSIYVGQPPKLSFIVIRDFRRTSKEHSKLLSPYYAIIWFILQENTIQLEAKPCPDNTMFVYVRLFTAYGHGEKVVHDWPAFPLCRGKAISKVSHLSG